MFDVVATAGLRLRPTSIEQVSNIELYGVMLENAGQKVVFRCLAVRNRSR